MAGDRRVVITGMGVRTPVGHTLEAFFDALVAGASGVVYVPEWDAMGNLRTRVGGRCAGVDETGVPRRNRRTMGRVAILAALAMEDAVADSGLGREQASGPRCGVSFGSTAGSCITQEEVLRPLFATNSLRGMTASSYLHYMSHTCAANLAMTFQAEGPVVASCSACVSGSQGVGYGCEQIRLGRAEIMLCGGAEELHFMDAAVFDVMRATSTRYNHAPDRTPRPFDADRDGLVVAEGAGCLVIEDFEHARARGARIHAEVLGFGNTSDGHHITTARPEGLAAAMRAALADAGVGPERIGYVCAHATATSVGDTAEAAATREVMGDKIPVSSLKGHMGHTLGAAGAIETVASVLMMHKGVLVPTRNLTRPDPEIAGLDHVMAEPREVRTDLVMNNNFAFGGLNTSLVLGRV